MAAVAFVCAIVNDTYDTLTDRSTPACTTTALCLQEPAAAAMQREHQVQSHPLFNVVVGQRLIIGPR